MQVDRKNHLKIQGKQQHTMTELRKLLRFNKSSFGVTIPEKYRKGMQLDIFDYLEISLHEKDTLSIKKHRKLEK